MHFIIAMFIFAPMGQSGGTNVLTGFETMNACKASIKVMLEAKPTIQTACVMLPANDRAVDSLNKQRATEIKDAQ